ncbi:MAG: hypothetical protein KBS56_03390 [Clostridiales bacterium]|nr:hypothetical protein [Candidatus Crickella equi]
MKYDEVWAYPINRIQEYFDSTNKLDCQVDLECLPEREVGPISFPQTRVVIEGEKAEDVYHGFYLHFLSGGA